MERDLERMTTGEAKVMLYNAQGHLVAEEPWGRMAREPMPKRNQAWYIRKAIRILDALETLVCETA